MNYIEQQRDAAKRLHDLPFEIGLLEDLIDNPTIAAHGDPRAAERDRQTHMRNYAKLLEDQRKCRALLRLDS